jgi:hypothetical protein
MRWNCLRRARVKKFLVRVARVCMAAALIINFAVAQRPAPERTPGEYEVKAAFLLNFVKFIEWPTQDRSAGTFSICVVGNDPFGSVLDRAVQGEAIDGRPIAVERVRRWQSSCRVLFVSSAEPDASKVLAGVGSGVLTVGEEERFLREGGMIAFVVEEHRVRFDVNAKSVQSGSLRISSRMLSVARKVIP